MTRGQALNKIMLAVEADRKKTRGAFNVEWFAGDELKRDSFRPIQLLRA